MPVTGDDRLNSRTFLRRVSKFAEKVKATKSDFAMLDRQESTVNRQLIDRAILAILTAICRYGF